MSRTFDEAMDAMQGLTDTKALLEEQAAHLQARGAARVGPRVGPWGWVCAGG
jgi:hypothetical protein